MWNLTGGAKGVGGTTRHVTDVTTNPNPSLTLSLTLTLPLHRHRSPLTAHLSPFTLTLTR